MTELEVERGAQLLRQRRMLEDQLCDRFVKRVETKRNWSQGSTVDAVQSTMLNKVIFAQKQAEELLANEAKYLIGSINDELEKLGVVNAKNSANTHNRRISNG